MPVLSLFDHPLGQFYDTLLHLAGQRSTACAAMARGYLVAKIDTKDAPMGTNVSLTAELESFAQSCVESGRYNNVSEVIRSGLRMLLDAEKHRAAFVASLDAALEEGLREGLSTIEEVEAEVSAAIDEVRKRKERAA